MTMGSAGAYCFTGQEQVFQPAIGARAVDTTAAGDTFTGYFLQGLTAGRPLAACLKQAAAAAALSVAKEGPLSLFPIRSRWRKCCMVKLMIVDDEPLALEAFAELTEWEVNELVERTMRHIDL